MLITAAEMQPCKTPSAQNNAAWNQPQADLGGRLRAQRLPLLDDHMMLCDQVLPVADLSLLETARSMICQAGPNYPC